LDVTVEVDRDGKVSVTISDETGYSPDVCDDFLRRCRETALATHRELHPAEKETA
jgi:hypothetical protein